MPGVADDLFAFAAVVLVLVGLPAMAAWIWRMNAKQEERSEARHDHLIAILLRAKVQSARALAHPVVHRRNKIGFSYEPRACLPMVVHHPERSGDTEGLASPRARKTYAHR